MTNYRLPLKHAIGIRERNSELRGKLFIELISRFNGKRYSFESFLDMRLKLKKKNVKKHSYLC